MKNVTHEADFCVIGGGMAVIAAALAAARHGAKTVLIQDRGVLPARRRSYATAKSAATKTSGAARRATPSFTAVKRPSLSRVPGWSLTAT